jgi:predicted methyltransferase
VVAALADPSRPPQQRALDPLRKPGPVIVFAGLKPGATVADFMSGNAYFTRLFSRVVGAHGWVYAVLPSEQLAHCDADEVAGSVALEHDGSFPNLTVLRTPAAQFVAPRPLDLFFLSQGYHDLHDAFMQPTDIDRFNRAVFAALKSGGVYLILDHAASAGSGLKDTETLHRIDPAAIRAEVQRAGFRFTGQSEALRNPEDTHQLLVFDPAIRHHTDQVILKFQKP